MAQSVYFFRQENEKIQLVKETYFTYPKFRKGQDFHDDQIVTYNIVGKDVSVFRKIVDDKYRLAYIYTTDSLIDREVSDLIRKFVNGSSDFYYVDGNLYDVRARIICQASKEVMYWLSKSRSFYVNNQVYISFITNSVDRAVVLFNSEPKVIFTSSICRRLVYDYQRCYGDNLEIITLDPILFKNFKLSRKLVKQLSLLGSFEEIKERVQKELFISVI
jgi:hypothetical protein